MNKLTRNDLLKISFFLLFCATTIFNHALASKNKSCHFPAIFNFGASNADTGGFSAVFFQLKSPNGDTFFRKPSGRFADGRIIIDFTAESLDLPFLSPYLNSLASNFSHGASFATAASTIRLPETIIPHGRSSPFFLGLQYDQFAQFKARSQTIRQRGGVYASLMPKKAYFAKALYTFDIGQNDLTHSLSLNKTAKEVMTAVSDIANQFTDNIRNLYGLGARSFWVYNTRPIGCYSAILTSFPLAEKDSAGCAKPHDELVQHFNAKLKKGLAMLRNELSQATIVYVDIYSAVYSLFASPAKYGFELPLVACCGYGGEYNYNDGARCGQTRSFNGTNIKVGSCKDPSVRVSWDGTHLTEAANKFVFDRVSTGAFSDPPIPLKLACHRRKPTSTPA